MNSRRFVLGAATAALTAFSAFTSSAYASEKLSVVTTFSILQDMVQRVGGEQVTVTTLVGANGDAHVYQPTPADARAINSAEVLVMNGLEFEGWLERLIEAAAFKGKMVVTTAGVEPIAFGEAHDEHHGDEHGAFDPHAWQSIEAAIIYVNNISAALTQAKPENSNYFEQNRVAYVAELKALDAEIKARGNLETVIAAQKDAKVLAIVEMAIGQKKITSAQKE
ncbi:MAG: metal ABC transporter solute-binding protein, Zn/Mn family, partial [Alphaproteobacteria bacterium]